MSITIYRRDASVLFTAAEASTEAEAIKGRADLSRADLSRADLREADLSRADLREADLSRADLRRAYLSRADLRRADLSGADLNGAYLSGADLRGAYLSGANLSGADLSGADLSGAYLSGAILSGADLNGANLSRAYLSGAIGLNPWQTNPLMMLLDQPGFIRAYKLVTADGEGPVKGGLNYLPADGHIVSVGDANTDPLEDCGAGINVATFDWVAREWREGYRVLVVDFVAADIACIPHASDGKFRLHRCRVVGEITDLAARELGGKR